MIYLDEAINERKSVRKFKRKVVENDKILKILNAGRQAPSAKNRQPWRFNVLSEQQKNQIAEWLDSFAKNSITHGTEMATAQIIRSAPNAIAITLTDTTISDYISLGACLENMCLKAVDLGLGSLIVCDTQSINTELTEMFGDNCFAALFVVGYSDDDSSHQNKKSLSEIVCGMNVYSEAPEVIDDLPEADINNEPFIFISYSHRDARIVISDIKELKKFGVRLWYDRSICYGDNWDEKALSVIDKPNCKGVLLYVSDDALCSESIAKEINHAKQRFNDNSRIIGVHIGDKSLSDYSIPPNYRRRFHLFETQKKYIPRATTPGVFNVIPIVAEAERLGVIATSGVYDGFSYEICPGGACITGYNGCSHVVEVISSVSGVSVVSIGKNAFRGNGNVQKIIIPFTVNRIEEGAFFGLTELQNVELPPVMDYLGVAAFRGCSKLKKVRLPNGIKVLTEALFRDCTALVECDVPKTVVELGEAVFRNCSSLIRVDMPTVEKMTEGGFFGCVALRDININPDIQGLESQSFATCPLVNITAGGFTYVNGKTIA